MRYRAWMVAVGTLAWCSLAIPAYARLSGTEGWERKTVYFEEYEGLGGKAEDIDIDGEVGHPLSVYGPTANCSTGSWTVNISVASGTLPPGLAVSKESSTFGWIMGIPTERGHWIVTMDVSDNACGGESYEGFTQQLRFHITGTGKVIE